MANDFTEAPASVNFKFSYKGFHGVMLTLRASTGQEVLTKLDGAIIALDKMGAVPATNGTGRSTTATNGNAPACPTHQKKMLKSKHGEGFFCPAKIADDDGNGKAVYCKQKVK